MLKDKLYHLITKRTLGVLVAMLSLAALVLVGFTLWLPQYLSKAMSLSATQIYSQTIIQVRNIYSSEVAERLRGAKIPITHNYISVPHGIPTPATLTGKIAKGIKDDRPGPTIRLYSEYPFSWRKNNGDGGGTLDAFESQALLELKKDPTKTYYVFEGLGLQSVLRYAIAERMQTSCVACHNSQSDSPKKDWKPGDFGGVLEVTYPLSVVANDVNKASSAAGAVLFILTFIGFATLVVVYRTLKANTKSLEQAVVLRDEFISMAAHDLKGPLTPLVLNAQLNRNLAENGELDNVGSKKLAEIFRKIENLARRFALLIDNMLDVTRISSGQLALESHETDLSDVARNVLEQFKDDLSKENVTVNTEFCKKAVGNWDSFRLGQVISNLLSNAIKYGDGKPIDIKTDTANQHAYLVVRDHGIGISLEDQARLFEKFKRSQMTADIPGLGLGLFIVSRIVTAHGGVISVESKLGEGSTFTVKLPLTPS